MRHFIDIIAIFVDPLFLTPQFNQKSIYDENSSSYGSRGPGPPVGDGVRVCPAADFRYCQGPGRRADHRRLRRRARHHQRCRHRHQRPVLDPGHSWHGPRSLLHRLCHPAGGCGFQPRHRAAGRQPAAGGGGGRGLRFHHQALRLDGHFHGQGQQDRRDAELHDGAVPRRYVLGYHAAAGERCSGRRPCDPHPR